MSLRYYICPVVGNGATPDDAVRPAIADTLRLLLAAGQGYTCQVMADRSWCLCVCDIDDAAHVIINALPQVFAVPPRNVTVDQLTPLQQTRLQNKLADIGVAYVAGESIRELLRRIGRRINDQFLLEHDAPNLDAKLENEKP